MKNKKELSIYVHIPFCVRKCNYCDFLSFAADQDMQKRYVQALVQEIESFGSLEGEYEASTIFLGGGTPSIIVEEQMSAIIHALSHTFPISPQAEITIEMNPGTITRDKLACYRELGINRLSIGLQSARDEELRLLGRIHTREEFLQNFTWARELGFHNISVDVMSALPDQTMNHYQETLQLVTSLNPEHISSYSLILEEGTPFYQDPSIAARIPSTEDDRAMYEYTNRYLSTCEYHRYEISNYAKPGYESHHNSAYWTGKEYLGLGLGASSYLQGARFRQQDSLPDYLNTPALSLNQHPDYHQLSQTEAMEEFMFLGLRMTQGVSSQDFQTRFGIPIETIYALPLHKHQTEGLLRYQTGTYRLTPKGMDLSNYVMCDFLLDSELAE